MHLCQLLVQSGPSYGQQYADVPAAAPAPQPATPPVPSLDLRLLNAKWEWTPDDALKVTAWAAGWDMGQGFQTQGV